MLTVGLETKASAQRRSLVGTAERSERIGGDPGGVLGPGMVFSESFFVGRESSLAVRERFRGIAVCQKHAREIVTARGCIGMLGAEHLLEDRQRALEERPRPRKIALVVK